jgi:3-oxoacyl-[acyl-carrier-protein] synthase II
MSALITGSSLRTCFGDADATFRALRAGATGVGPLRCGDAGRLGVTHGYHIDDGRPAGDPLRASAWLADCVAEALAQAGVDPRTRRVVAIVGTGLRESRVVEEWATGVIPPATERMHFADAVRAAAPGLREVTTIANACSASGHALALAQDMVELGDADAVVVAGTDAMTESMLAMIGRVAVRPTEQVRPFDADRTGVLLGEGACAFVVTRDGPAGLGRVLATGLSCDAHHETAPDAAGITRAMIAALTLAGRSAHEIDLVVAHGTGTELNDPTEATVLDELFSHPGPAVTAVKGATGHTSGGAALLGVAVALDCLAGGDVPPVTGLREPLPEGARLRFVRDTAAPLRPRLVQVNAFGFGGVNSVTLVEAA